MTIEHETLVTVNLDPDEAAVVLRALAHEALVQTGRGEDADHYREEARKLAAEIVGDNNCQHPCDEDDCLEYGDHTPRDEHWCADHCPDCNKEEP